MRFYEAERSSTIQNTIENSIFGLCPSHKHVAMCFQEHTSSKPLNSAAQTEYPTKATTS